jgi:two-component system KDP operon response regulator KdpE
MIDLVSRSVMLGEERITLTRKEYRLLHILASHLGLVVTHQQLIKEIWGRSQGDNVQYLRMLVRKLRQKIEVDSNQPKFLMTESGVGYRLERIKQEELVAR